MHRIAGALVVAFLFAGCGLGSTVLPVDPACERHPDPMDCQAALTVALDETRFDPETFAISVAPITCADRVCSTWVSAVPRGDDCLPSYEVELAREGAGAWTVGMNTHGDPPCAFEP
jgi:hypothetical protein